MSDEKETTEDKLQRLEKLLEQAVRNIAYLEERLDNLDYSMRNQENYQYID